MKNIDAKANCPIFFFFLFEVGIYEYNKSDTWEMLFKILNLDQKDY